MNRQQRRTLEKKVGKKGMDELTQKMLGEEGIRKILTTVPIRRMANVEEIARFVVWLSSPENSYITGQNIAIDGGFSRV